ncbi:MAG: AAA family ATPase [Halobacteriovoraceae bacterium]|nr:AAA family ATPase [Halobacteriovoraceae bacterium]
MKECRDKVSIILEKAKKVVFGQDALLDSIIAALVCEGHVLIEGMPGLGKTFSISVLSRLCDLEFKRIQFTPDLLPTDLIGTMVYSQKTEKFTTKFGPIFTQLLLADEINRSPAKVQAALLEAMAEKQVSVGDDTYKLNSPFVVLATQNPIDQEGTYTLPEAQMDRFMMKVNVEYPNFQAEKNVLELKQNSLDNILPVISKEDILEMQQAVSQIYIDEKIKDLIIRIVHATRPSSELFLKKYNGIILAGASPRASIWLYKIGKFMAFMDGKDFVSPDHLIKIVPNVLGHRIILAYEATIDKIDPRDIAINIAESLI